MRHLKSFNKLNRTHSHRKMLYKNMSISLFKHSRIKTTKIKAREIRRIVEKLITKAKTKTLHNIRVISRIIKDKAILMKLFDEIAPVYIDRNGGYTRIVKLGRRKGDGADLVYLELIQEHQVSSKKKKKKKIETEAIATKEAKPEVKKEEIKKEEVKEDKSKKAETKKTKVEKVKEEETDTEKKPAIKKDNNAEEVKIKKEKIKVDDKKKKEK